MLAAVALLGAVTGFGLPADPVAASPTPDATEGLRAATTDGPCQTAQGVTVVIDFQELEGGSSVYCAPNSPANGFDALKQAGISWDVAASSNGFLCRIAGRPSASGTPVVSPKNGDPSSVKDVCRVPSPTTAYWSYWLAPRGGYWCYSNVGAGTRRPPAGTVEGWSFVLNRSASTTPPPRIAPPAPIPGVAATQLPGKDCTVPTEGAPPPTTTTAPPPSPATTRPPTVPGPTTPGTPSSPSGPSGPSRPTRPGRPTGPGSLDGATSKPGDTDGPTSPGEGKTTTTVPSDGSTSTTNGIGEAATGDGTEADDGDPPAGVEGSGSRGITDPDEIAALEGDVDLGDDGRGKGSPIPLVAAGVVAVGLVAGGVLQRRRRQAAPNPA